MHAFPHTDYFDFADTPDVDEPMRYGWCCACERNVDIVEEDHGIGAYEYWGSSGVHHDWQDTCQECGSTDVERERHNDEETEEIHE